jgi:hypothetical protein
MSGDDQSPLISVEQLVRDVLKITMADVQDPRVFIEGLRQYHEAPNEERGPIANGLAELIIRKRVDLAEVRRQLLDSGEAALFDTLDRLVDLIEPYIEEGGVEE